MLRILVLLSAWGGLLSAQVALLPLRDVRAGMRGVGKTVFAGSRIEDFQVEILGVLENAGPRQALILARLSGGPLAHTGVMQGMSGSPVYIDGRLIGAVAMAFPYSKDPIAGIRPIEEMMNPRGGEPPLRAQVCLLCAGEKAWKIEAPRRETGLEGKLAEIATPVSFSGFSARTLEQFRPQLQQLGLEPRQGVSGGGPARPAAGDPSKLKPGSMISVELVSGDLAIGADGTVTHIDGKRLYAFGHRFLAVGGAEMPFAESQVLTLLPNLSTSFKISTARGWLGTITGDYSTAVSGEIGRRPTLVPVSITMGPVHYQLQVVYDSVLTPFLLQMAVFSVIDATERAVGPSTYRLSGAIEFRGPTPPVKLNNMYAGDFNMPLQVALGVASPVAYAMQSGFDSLRVKAITLNMDSLPEKKQVQIDQVWASKKVVRPGETVELTTVFAGDKGLERSAKVSYTVPMGAQPGPLYFTVADALVTNITEYRQTIGAPQRSAHQVISLLNGLRPNQKAYVRIWRAPPSYGVLDEDLPDPPASVALVLSKGSGGTANPSWSAGSKMAEREISAGDAVVTGSRTIQVEIKE